MTTKKECLIYMRTSTLTNVKGDSVKRQKSSIMKWVKSNGYSVRGEYWDVESGSKDTLDRPEFMRMISDSERMGIRNSLAKKWNIVMTNDSPTISSFKPKAFSGRGEETLTIKGKNFSSSGNPN